MTETVAPVLRGFLHGTEDGMSKIFSPAFFGLTPATKQFLPLAYSGTFGMELAGLAGDALGDDLGVFVDQNGHPMLLGFDRGDDLGGGFWPWNRSEMIGRPESLRFSCPDPSLVPFMRTTSGTERPFRLAAATTPVAMVSQRMMPPKMLTRMPLTLGF